MTDRYKSILVELDREIRDDDAESLLIALKMIKGVWRVKPYVMGAEDYSSYAKGCHDTKMKLYKLIAEED